MESTVFVPSPFVRSLRASWRLVKSPKVMFIQLPLVTKPSAMEAEEADYYDAYWAKMEEIFGRRFPQAEVYTVPEFPLWVTVLANAVEDAGCRASFIDLARYTGPSNLIPYDEIARLLSASPADCYALSPFTNNYSVAVKILRLIKEHVSPDARVLVGGAHATATASRCIEDGFDGVARGRGEELLASFLRCMQAAQPERLCTVPGLTYKENEIARSNPENPSKRYDYFNRLPHYGLISVDYKVHFGRVYTSLGCPYGCSFCADTLWIKMKPFYKQLNVIVNEIRLIRDRYGVDLFLFGDEVFTLNVDFAGAVCAAIRDEGIKWFCQTRANLLVGERQPVLKKMAASGCRMVQIGAESADEAVLASLEKRVTFDVVQNACRFAKDAGLNVLTYWMVGGPGETFDSARRTMDCIMSLFDEGITDLADYYICTPYPGTDLFEKPEKYDVEIINKGFDNWREDQPSVMRTKELDEYQIFDLWKQGLAQIAAQMRKPLGTKKSFSFEAGAHAGLPVQIN